MDFILKKIVALILISITLLACNNKKIEEKHNVLFLIESFDANKDSIIKVMLINNTNNNYYITMDTNRTYDYSAFNYKINNSIILRPFVYNEDKLISTIGKGFTQKTIGIDRGKMKCIESEVNQSDAFYKDYIMLKNAVFIKRKSSRYMEIPFHLKYKSCYFTYNYDLEKNKQYELRLEYQMIKETIEKSVIKSKLDSVRKLGFTPYYEKIISNRVPIIIE